MALSLILSEAHRRTDGDLRQVTLEQVEGGYAVTAVHLTLKAKIAVLTRRRSKSSPTMARPDVRMSCLQLFKADVCTS